MSRRPPPKSRAGRKPRPEPTPVAPATPSEAPAPRPASFLQRYWVAFAVTVLLVGHTAAAVRSLIQENPTVDEVIHLPAGVTYWQTGTFRLGASQIAGRSLEAHSNVRPRGMTVTSSQGGDKIRLIGQVAATSPSQEGLAIFRAVIFCPRRGLCTEHWPRRPQRLKPEKICSLISQA